MSEPKQPKNWSPDQLRFIEWLALPKTERNPKTQRLLAQKLGIDEGTLSDWKHLDGFLDEVNSQARELVKHDVPDVLGKIRQQAKAGSLPHQNMVLAMAGLEADIANAGKGPGEAPIREIVVRLHERPVDD